MNKIFLSLTIYVFSSLLYISTSYAEERELSLNLTSNYVFRGLTQTNDKAAVQTLYKLSKINNSVFYAGFFASNVAQGAEVDIFGGLKLAFGKNDAFIIDLGAVEYLYTDNNFAPISHEFYVGVEHERTYLKYYFGEEEARYLDFGTGFDVLGDLVLLLHVGEVFATAQNGNDISITLQKEFSSTKLGVTATYENKTAAKASELFAFLTIDF